MHSPLLPALLFLAMPAAVLTASPSNSSVDPRPVDDTPAQGLPCWEEGDCAEAFDVRLWPESTVLWLEQENLRDLIADPATPETEREQLRRILAMQSAWKKIR